MKYRFILLSALLFVICGAKAQYHFTATINYSGHCDNSAIQLYQTWKNAIELVASLPYPSQSSCESVRQGIDGIYNMSVGGCTIKTTLSPCSGTPMNTANMTINGEPSLYSSLRDAGFYFSPTDRDKNRNIIEELLNIAEIYNQNAKNAENRRPILKGVTGDNDVDDQYVRDLKKKFQQQEQRANTYNIVERKEIDWTNAVPNIDDRVTLYNYEMNNDGPYVSIDPERMANMAREAEYEESIIKMKLFWEEQERKEKAYKQLEAMQAWQSKNFLEKTADRVAAFSETLNGWMFVAIGSVEVAKDYVKEKFNEEVSTSLLLEDLDESLEGSKAGMLLADGNVWAALKDVGEKTLDHAVINPFEGYIMEELESSMPVVGKPMKNAKSLWDVEHKLVDNFSSFLNEGTNRFLRDERPHSDFEINSLMATSIKTVANGFAEVLFNH